MPQTEINDTSNPQPCSNRILELMKERILSKSLKNINVTLVAFKGSGNTAQLRYLTQEISGATAKDRTNIFAYLDLKSLSENTGGTLFECMAYVKTHSSNVVNIQALAELDRTHSDNKIEFALFIDFLNHLTFNKKLPITFILDNTYLIYKGGKNHQSLRSLINSIKKVNPMKISFIYLADREFDEKAAEYLAELSLSFIENIEWGKEYLFDRDSALRLFKNQENWNNYKFNEKFKEKCIKLSIGDPSVLKHLSTKTMSDPNFEQLFLKESAIKNIYELCGRDFLDIRFSNIVRALSQKSLDFLSGKTEEPTEFLLKTGLVNKFGSGYSYVNDFFEYFVKNYKTDFGKYNTSGTDTLLEIKKLLSGQELQIFQLFEEKEDVLISKDEIAKTIWGNDWEDKYSDWAIDKAISNVRKKLAEAKYQKTIKSIKGSGFKLI